MRAFVERAAQGLVGLHPKLETTAVERAAALLDAHRRVRTAAGAKGLRYRVDPLLPADVLGLYVYLPA